VTKDGYVKAKRYAIMQPLLVVSILGQKPIVSWLDCRYAPVVSANDDVLTSQGFAELVKVIGV